MIRPGTPCCAPGAHPSVATATPRNDENPGSAWAFVQWSQPGSNRRPPACKSIMSGAESRQEHV